MAHNANGQAHARTASTEHRASWSWKSLFGSHATQQSPSSHAGPAATAAAASQQGADTDAADLTRARTLDGAAPLQEDIQRPGLAKRLSRKVVPGLPRVGTFKRQQSERRDRLEPHTGDRRTLSVDRRHGTAPRSSSSPSVKTPRLSAPELEIPEAFKTLLAAESDAADSQLRPETGDRQVDARSIASSTIDEQILEELDTTWMLNLSMHFRDKSKREKFFITYAETPTHWRRVTISLDYRDAPEGSLEEELSRTRYQRDKSARIYQAIRESLPEIQFFDTVTNLKLQTENERLHVNVVEDLAEIISYPSINAIKHLDCPRIREDELVFDSHLSGYVYKVRVDGHIWIKKEIPGPDTVEEFLYEVNALNSLSGSNSVIQFGGVVLDAQGELVKGLLISYAEKGALIDVIYDADGHLSWTRRERWARQIVQGLSEIHEAGFVQGDFTLSNIVIDDEDNAKIIDINRRGCPVGWEPPEVAKLVDSNQRLTMYIGVKSDLYQLGMVLYALACQQDEPEAHRPLDLRKLPEEVPDYYYDACRRCLSANPRMRTQAQVLLDTFPRDEDESITYHDGSSPIIVDVMPAHEDAFQVSYPVGYRHRYSRSSSRTHTLTTSSHDDSDYPPRGRSPPPPRYDAFPMPVGSRRHSHDYMDTLAGETLAVDGSEKSAADFEIVEDGIHDIAITDIALPKMSHPVFDVEGEEEENEEPPLSQGDRCNKMYAFLDTDPSQQPLPASTNTSQISLPLTHKTSNLSTTARGLGKKTSQNLRHILTERPQNIISPSPSHQSLRDTVRRTTDGAVPWQADVRTSMPAELPASPVSDATSHEGPSHIGTTTNTPFTPYTPHMHGNGFDEPACRGPRMSEEACPKAARHGDLVGVGTHLACTYDRAIDEGDFIEEGGLSRKGDASGGGQGPCGIPVDATAPASRSMGWGIS